VVSREFKGKPYDVSKFITYIEQKQRNPEFKMIVGWVYPEHYKDISDLNRIMENYKKDGQVWFYSIT
jgi:hypothetical protein